MVLNRALKESGVCQANSMVVMGKESVGRADWAGGGGMRVIHTLRRMSISRIPVSIICVFIIKTSLSWLWAERKPSV